MSRSLNRSWKYPKEYFVYSWWIAPAESLSLFISWRAEKLLLRRSPRSSRPSFFATSIPPNPHVKMNQRSSNWDAGESSQSWQAQSSSVPWAEVCRHPQFLRRVRESSPAGRKKKRQPSTSIQRWVRGLGGYGWCDWFHFSSTRYSHVMRLFLCLTAKC